MTLQELASTARQRLTASQKRRRQPRSKWSWYDYDDEIRELQAVLDEHLLLLGLSHFTDDAEQREIARLAMDKAELLVGREMAYRRPDGE